MQCKLPRRIVVEKEAPPEIYPTFADNEWSTIIYACENNLVPSTWAVADNKTMSIGGTNYRIDIIGKNHDTYASGGSAPLTFQLYDRYQTNYAMNSTNTNNGGWTNSAMRNTHLPAILALMPPEVQKGIKEVNKKTSAGNASTTINTTADKLFLLSEIEVLGSRSWSVNGEGSRYTYYATSSRRQNRGEWWLRSPHSAVSHQFLHMYDDGTTTGNSANTAKRVNFAFCF